MFKRCTALASALISIACLCAGVAGAAPFDPKGMSLTSSMGFFRIVVSPKFAPYFDNLLVGYPQYWDPLTLTMTSPVLIDPTTKIQRSAPFLESAEPVGGVPCGDDPLVLPLDDNTVKDGDFTLTPPAYETIAGTTEVHTNLYKMDMLPMRCHPAVAASKGLPQTMADHCAYVGPVEVKAGLATAGGHLCPGEVESWGSGGFPALSFFDVFVEVTIPGAPILNLYNKWPDDPLLVANNNLTSFPPQVVYIHENSTAVPIRIHGSGSFVVGLNTTNYVDGELVGWLTLSGHGTGLDCTDINACENFYNRVVASARELTLPKAPGTPLAGCQTFVVNLPEAPEGAGEFTRVPAPTQIEPGFIVLLDDLLGLSNADSLHWSDVVVIHKASGTTAQSIDLVSDGDGAVPGIHSINLLAAGVTMSDVVGGNTVYLREATYPTTYTAGDPACVAVTYNVFSDLSEVGVPSGAPHREFAIAALIPNPTTGATRVDWSLSSAGRAKVEIFGVAGERVRTLHDGPSTAGAHSEVWDGRADDGRLLPSGTYYVKLAFHNQTVTRKLLLVR